MSDIRSQYRFFLDPTSVSAGQVSFPAGISNQITRVLRLSRGAEVLVLDGSGRELVVELDVVGSLSTGHVSEERMNQAEPNAAVHVFPAVLRAKRLELVFQKCTEVGAASFTMVECERSMSDAPSASRLDRFHEIVREAAEQSGRGRVPVLNGVRHLTEALRNAPALPLIFSGGGDSDLTAAQLLPVLARCGCSSVSIFTGPEGGFSPQELQAAWEQGHPIVSLGPRTLRAETAAIVATALALHHLEKE